MGFRIPLEEKTVPVTTAAAAPHSSQRRKSFDVALSAPSKAQVEIAVLHFQLRFKVDFGEGNGKKIEKPSR